MQSMAERRTRKTLLTLRRVEERAALRGLATARRAVEAAEREKAAAEAHEAAAQARLTRRPSPAGTAGGLARREAWRDKVRLAARAAEDRRVQAAQAWLRAERAFDRARKTLEAAHQARERAEERERAELAAEQRVRDRREHRAAEDRRRTD